MTFLMFEKRASAYGNKRRDRKIQELENGFVRISNDKDSEKERQYVLEALDSQFKSSAGSVMTTRLESCLPENSGSRYAIAHINGTATMHSALAAVNIGPGDEVIVPPLTMSSTTFAVLHCQRKFPVFRGYRRGYVYYLSS